jgi:diacylglycerol kinase (ATP)
MVAFVTRYSYLGIRSAWEHEAAFRQEFGLAVILFPLPIWLARNGTELLLLSIPVLLLIMVELLNSVIEAVVDRIGDELHVLSGRAKDMGGCCSMFCPAHTRIELGGGAVFYLFQWLAILGGIRASSGGENHRTFTVLGLCLSPMFIYNPRLPPFRAHSSVG